MGGPTGEITHKLAAAAGLNVTRIAVRPTVAELEAFAGAPTLLVIALTADVLTTNLEHCQAAGTEAYLSKPFTLDQLHAIVASPRIKFDHPPSMPQPATYSTPHTALAQGGGTT